MIACYRLTMIMIWSRHAFRLVAHASRDAVVALAMRATQVWYCEPILQPDDVHLRRCRGCSRRRGPGGHDEANKGRPKVRYGTGSRDREVEVEVGVEVLASATETRLPPPRVVALSSSLVPLPPLDTCDFGPPSTSPSLSAFCCPVALDPRRH